MPRLPMAGVGHIAFRRDVTSVRAYARMCVRAYVRMSRSNLPASLGENLRPRFSCSFYTFWARKLKLCMTLTNIKTF